MSLIRPIKADVIRRIQTIVNGRPVNSIAAVFVDVSMSVQPLNGRELQILEEGKRSRETVKIYTKFQLQNADQHVGAIPDLIETPDGRLYEIFRIDGYGRLLDRIKAYAMRVQE
jgi:hypothetical protein